MAVSCLWLCVDFRFPALGPGEIDSERFRRAEHVLVELTQFDFLTGREHLDVEAKALHFLDQYFERLRYSGLGNVLTLDDGLVDLHAASHVVGFDGKQLLEGIGCAVRLEGPDFHLTKALAAELSLTTERLLGDHRVRAGGPCMNLVVHPV